MSDIAALGAIYLLVGFFVALLVVTSGHWPLGRRFGLGLAAIVAWPVFVREILR